MGEEQSKCVFTINGEEVAQYIPHISEISTRNYVDGKRDSPVLNGIYTATFRIKFPKTRKRFTKFLMANCMSRNQAQTIAQRYHDLHFSWYEAFVHAVLEIDVRKDTGNF